MPAVTFTASDSSSQTAQITVQAAEREVVLWVGATKLLSQPSQQAYLDVGFTGFVYSGGYMKGLGQSSGELSERAALLASNHDFSNSYYGIYLDTPGDVPPLGGFMDANHWQTTVYPAFADARDFAIEAGFKGLALDQELYSGASGQQAMKWRWDAQPGTEAQVREAAFVRGVGTAWTINGNVANRNMPVRIYHFDWPKSKNEYSQQSVTYEASQYLWKDWLDGLAAGGLDFGLYNSHVYKDYGWPASYTTGKPPPPTPPKSWQEGIDHQLSSIWPTHRHRYMPFGWLTAGPNATNAIQQGLPTTNIWDRQRSDSWIAAQVAAFKTASTEYAVYAYNLVGGAAQYAPFDL